MEMQWQAEISKKEAEILLVERQNEIEENLNIATGAFMGEIQIQEYVVNKSHLADCSCNRPSSNTNNRSALKRCLEKIQEAWVEIRDNAYGICRKCHNSIPAERLRARPETDLCVPCKNSL